MASTGRTTKDLVDIITAAFGSPDASVDITTYRYAIYCRKSTDSSEKQERSLGDQLDECTQFAERLNLNVVQRIAESASAHQINLTALPTQTVMGRWLSM